MNVSIPLIVIVAAVAWIAYRYMGMRVWHALVCLVFGFLLAATTTAPQLRALLAALVAWLQHP